MVTESEGVNGIEGGSAGADAATKRVGDGEGDSGWGDPTQALGPVELPGVEVSLIGASGGEDDGIPCRNPRWVTDR